MVHAFLLLYSCDRGCCKGRFEEEGKTGHGRPWMDAAGMLEKVIKRKMGDGLGLDLVVDLWREGSLALELERGENEGRMPEKRQLGKWGMKEKEVRWHRSQRRQVKRKKGQVFAMGKDG